MLSQNNLQDIPNIWVRRDNGTAWKTQRTKRKDRKQYLETECCAIVRNNRKKNTCNSIIQVTEGANEDYQRRKGQERKITKEKVEINNYFQ